MGRYSSYDPSNFPVGVSDFLNTFPPQRRNEILAAIADLHLRRKAEDEWVAGRMQGMVELPDTLYKYVPYQSLDYGLPKRLRATQPTALNDVMEGNIRTSMEGRIDRDEWYAKVFESLNAIFLNDAPSAEEMARRKNLYGDPRVSTIIRDYLSRHVGVVSLSTDPLIPTMWAHYAKNSGFVIGYKTEELKALGIDLRRVLYLELAPVYYPTRDNVVRLQFVDEERRKEKAQSEGGNSGIPILSSDVEFFELRKDWRELEKALFVKGETWENEKEVRLLVDLQDTCSTGEEKFGYEIRVIDVPAEAVAEVFVGFNTPRAAVDRIRRVVGVGEGTWKLIHTDSHAYRMQTTVTSIESRTKTTGQTPPEPD